MIDTLYTEFGEVRIFSNFVVAVMNEGVSIKNEYYRVVKNISEKYYSDKLFGYISFRKNSYAVDPLVYLKTSKLRPWLLLLLFLPMELNLLMWN